MPDSTYETAERLIGECRAREIAQEQEALKEPTIASACAKGYGLAVRDLEGAAINLRAFTRGMIPSQLLASYIREAREALDRAEQALVTP